MNRDQHLQWCKDRAKEYLDRGDISQAMTSFSSDLRKHPETAGILENPMYGPMLFASAGSVREARAFITGWN